MKEETSEKIARAAARVLARHGVQGVSMRRVAAAVGITPMALYRHYANRDGLLRTLADEGFKELAARLPLLPRAPDADRQLMKILDVHLDFAFEKPRLFELMFMARREGARQYPQDFTARRSPTANVAADVIAQGMQNGEFRKADVWEIVLETGALLQGMVMLYLGGRIEMAPEQFRKLCHRSFRRYMHGIRA